MDLPVVVVGLWMVEILMALALSPPIDTEICMRLATALGNDPGTHMAQMTQLTLKNSPNVELYGLHGFPLTYFCGRDECKVI